MLGFYVWGNKGPKLGVTSWIYEDVFFLSFVRAVEARKISPPGFDAQAVLGRLGSHPSCLQSKGCCSRGPTGIYSEHDFALSLRSTRKTFPCGVRICHNCLPYSYCEFNTRGPAEQRIDLGEARACLNCHASWYHCRLDTELPPPAFRHYERRVISFPLATSLFRGTLYMPYFVCPSLFGKNKVMWSHIITGVTVQTAVAIVSPVLVVILT